MNCPIVSNSLTTGEDYFEFNDSGSAGFKISIKESMLPTAGLYTYTIIAVSAGGSSLEATGQM